MWVSNQTVKHAHIYLLGKPHNQLQNIHRWTATIDVRLAVEMSLHGTHVCLIYPTHEHAQSKNFCRPAHTSLLCIELRIRQFEFNVALRARRSYTSSNFFPVLNTRVNTHTHTPSLSLSHTHWLNFTAKSNFSALYSTSRRTQMSRGRHVTSQL